MTTSHPKGYHETLDELETWSRYAETSLEAFTLELQKWQKKAALQPNDVVGIESVLSSLKKIREESTIVRNRARKLHGR